MLSEKLDLIMAAEESAAEKIANAEKTAEKIVSDAKIKAEAIREEKILAAKNEAADIINGGEEKCCAISETYAENASVEANRLSKIASKNEMFGMSAVIMKIIP
ncbi:MAG: hypothetical protein J6M35_07520 [Clostridia bacterium]|nr:hypothetical protein [Clostridia bacterium]